MPFMSGRRHTQNPRLAAPKDFISLIVSSSCSIIDLAILTNYRHFNIPTYIIRCKVDQHISNLMVDSADDSGDGEEEEDRKKEASPDFTTGDPPERESQPGGCLANMPNKEFTSCPNKHCSVS